MKLFDYLFALPKTLYFNLRYFGLKGLKFPILISHHTVLRKLKGQIGLPENAKFAGIRIGFGDVPIFDKRNSRAIFSNEGKITFSGRAKVGHGGKIIVKKNAHLTLGNRFNMSAESTIYCCNEITFGRYNLLSWDVQVMDSDLHDIYSQDAYGIAINPPQPIKTGDSVWFCSRTNILKGVTIASNSIISSQTNVTRSLEQSHCIYGGNPARVIKSHICWDSAARDYVD